MLLLSVLARLCRHVSFISGQVRYVIQERQKQGLCTLRIGNKLDLHGGSHVSWQSVYMVDVLLCAGTSRKAKRNSKPRHTPRKKQVSCRQLLSVCTCAFPLEQPKQGMEKANKQGMAAICLYLCMSSAGSPSSPIRMLRPNCGSNLVSSSITWTKPLTKLNSTWK